MNYSLFTSESVCTGHPDKICDQISDAILDAALSQDKSAKVAVEAVVKDRVILAGELTSFAKIDYESIVRSELKRLGYTNPEWGFSDNSPVEVHINQQSPEIAVGVKDDSGAGDQGMMFGYACRDTQDLMPLPITLAHALTRQIDNVRENSTLDWLRPDGKTQVTVRYEKNKPVAIEKVVIAVAHDESVELKKVSSEVIQQIVNPVLARYKFHINPENVIVNGTGVWHIPGPANDAGLTGRKIIVDSYGGFARVGGGAFSGKDPSKVDRSGAYAARFLAKNIVAAGLSERCEVALAYAIGKPKPVMQAVETFGTSNRSPEELSAFCEQLLDISVKGIIDGLDLRRPIYKQTASYGHFGRKNLPWEKLS